MRVDYSQTKPAAQAGSELVIANIASLTVLLSSVLILGAICRFLKRCCKKIGGKRHQDHDVITFTPITTHPLRRSSSTSQLMQQKIRYHSEFPYHTKERSVQPDSVGGREILPMRPRAATNPTAMFQRQRSFPCAEPRCSIIGASLQLEITARDLDPTLYKKEASLQRFQAITKKKCGMLDTEVYFDAGTSELKVTVNKIQHLPINNYTNLKGTYVMVKNLPDTESKRTNVYTNIIDPVFNEDFSFRVSSEDDVSSHVLVFELLHIDQLATSRLRASARLPLFQIDLLLRRRLLIPFIESRRPLFSSLYPAYYANSTGCFLISLQYQPAKNAIVVNPIRVCNIPAKKHGGFGQDVFVKVLLGHRGTRISKAKTQSAKTKRMPGDRHYYQAKFNEPLNLPLYSQPVQECDITVSLNYYLLFRTSFIIGQIRLSVDEPGYEAIHYQNMIDSPGDRISTWYEMQGFFTSSE